MPRITPRETLPVSRLIYIYHYYLVVPSRTQNLYLLNKCLIIFMWAAKAVPPSFIPGIHILVPGNAHLLVRYLLETSPWTARRTRARLAIGVIPLQLVN